MKIEIRCSECDNAWLIDESTRGGELLCPKCLTRIALPGGPVPEATDPGPEPGIVAEPDIPLQPLHEALASAAHVRTDTDSAPFEEPAADPVDGLPTENCGQPGSEIVCPRCQLHFLPWGREANRQRDQRHTILIVDDLGYFRHTAQDSLVPRFVVRTAENTSQARAILAAEAIDLIIVDLALEGGRLFISELKPKPCPILIYTAQDESDLYGDSWEELAALGADDLVLKGMNLDETLARKVGNLLQLPADEEQRIG